MCERTRAEEDLRTVNEELTAMNEEMVAVTDELQHTNQKMLLEIAERQIAEM